MKNFNKVKFENRKDAGKASEPDWVDKMNKSEADIK